MIDVTILTEERFVNHIFIDEYCNNVLVEDDLLIQALNRLGLKTNKVAWNDNSYDWSRSRFSIFRSTWDYSERYRLFHEWLIATSSKTDFINDFDTITWNLDKHYLQNLLSRGVNIVETYFVQKRDNRSLGDIVQYLAWDKIILKPCVSAGAKDTYRLDSAMSNQYEAKFKALIQKKALMIQPFQKSILERGEVSMILIDGRYTHAVLKKAQVGDFRVQDDFGGTVHSYEPTKDEMALAASAIDVCESVPAYARVDLATDNDGKPAVMELELFEPELWFRRFEPAAHLLAQAISKRL